MALSQQRQGLSAIILAARVSIFFSVAHCSHYLSARNLDSDLTGPRLHFHGQERVQEQTRVLPPTIRARNAARVLINSVSDISRQVARTSWPNGSNDFTADELDRWNGRNPCLSRVDLSPMYQKRKHSRNIPPNPFWEELLSEYSKLHRICTKSVRNLTQYFLTGNVSTGCKFVISDVGTNATGLGIKFLANISTLLYAILTKRVLLVVSTSLIPDCTCEPFLGSSWVLDPTEFPLQHLSSNLYNGSWMSGTDFFKRIDEDIKQTNLSKHRPNFAPTTWEDVHAVHMMDKDSNPNSRFYEQTEQNFLSEVTWLQFSGGFLSIPSLFAASPFRHILEALFPNKMAPSYLLRSTHLPSDSVWDLALAVQNAYVDDRDQIVGIQTPYDSDSEHYERLNDLFNERIVNCTRENSILPDVNEGIHPSFARHSSVPIKSRRNPAITVYIASPFPGLLSHLSQRFMHSSTVTGEDVAIIQISRAGHRQQRYMYNNVEDGQQALAEVMLLSFSDQLLISPGSAVGALAQAYGGMTPWLLEIREDKSLPACRKSQTAERCNIAADQSSKYLHKLAGGNI